MSLYKRKNVWWIDITHNHQRIQKSTGTFNKQAAQQFHDQVKADLWREHYLDQKPDRTWHEAVTRWLEESSHKNSIADDKLHLRWLDPYLAHVPLKNITRDLIDDLAKKRQFDRRNKRKKEDASRPKPLKAATVNRMLEVVRAILRRAEKEWNWLDKAPNIRMIHEDNRRIRWITREEAKVLIKELPPHLADMVAFSLATGLRKRNVTRLEWSQVDLVRRHALVHPDQAKAKKAIPVPLNREAMSILQRQVGKHEQYVFTYEGKPITQCNTKAWRNALARAKIKNFRWHDLRHTWASWHVQSGTSLQELQQLGAWSSFEMVLRYAHLSSDHLREAAERITERNSEGVSEKSEIGSYVTNFLHPAKKGLSEVHLTP